jgi:hypothetical protein
MKGSGRLYLTEKRAKIQHKENLFSISLPTGRRIEDL